MPNAIRSVFAVVFGYIVMIVVVIPLTLIAVKAFGVHSGHPAPSYLVYNVAASLLAAFAGGWVAGRIAPSRRVAHGIALGLLVLVMAWLSYRHYAGQQPFWYQRLLIVAPAALAILGAWSAKRSTDIGRTDE
jgi:putative membrane protein (TIGR04086 family)